MFRAINQNCHPRPACRQAGFDRGSMDSRLRGNDKLIIFIMAGVLILFSLPAFAADLPLQLIKLPPGFKIEIYADGIENARQMTLGQNGTVFVGNRSQDKVYALVDQDHDGKAEQKFVVAEGLTAPNGVAFKGGSLYVAEINRITRYDNIESQLAAPPKPVVVNESLPQDTWHGWKYIAFGPDGKLYVPLGMPCNVCEKEDPRYGTIMQLDPSGGPFNIFAKGVRNTVGFDWDPLTKELWFTDNGRDELGDNIPPDELNHAPQTGMNFGFPYCHGKNISDPEFGQKHACSEFTVAAQELGPHVASLGMKFYTGKTFPADFQNQIFIAEHGSWNRSAKIGYRITLVTLDQDRKTPTSYKVFAEGWKVGEKVWGRPVDLLNLPDGSFLVSDDFAGVIYRISYQEKK